MGQKGDKSGQKVDKGAGNGQTWEKDGEVINLLFEGGQDTCILSHRSTLPQAGEDRDHFHGTIGGQKAWSDALFGRRCLG